MHSENIKLDNGEVADLSKHKIDDILNNTFINNIKNEFRQGFKPEICNACWIQENNNFLSKRQIYANIVDFIDIENSNILYLDLKMGKARYKQSKPLNIDVSLTELPKNDQYWNNIFTIVPTIQELEFTGECFDLPDHNKLIEFMINFNHASKVTLHYKTNGSKTITHFKEKWKFFKNIRITLSLYDIEEHFLTDWYECTWQELIKNLNQLFDLTSQDLNLSLCFVSTIDNNNRHRKEIIYNWAKQQPFSAIVFNEK